MHQLKANLKIFLKSPEKRFVSNKFWGINYLAYLILK